MNQYGFPPPAQPAPGARVIDLTKQFTVKMRALDSGYKLTPTVKVKGTNKRVTPTIVFYVPEVK